MYERYNEEDFAAKTTDNARRQQQKSAIQPTKPVFSLCCMFFILCSLLFHFLLWNINSFSFYARSILIRASCMERSICAVGFVACFFFFCVLNSRKCVKINWLRRVFLYFFTFSSSSVFFSFLFSFACLVRFNTSFSSAFLFFSLLVACAHFRTLLFFLFVSSTFCFEKYYKM